MRDTTGRLFLDYKKELGQCKIDKFKGQCPWITSTAGSTKRHGGQMDGRCSMKMGGGPHDVVVVVIEWTTEFGSQAANPSFPLERGKKEGSYSF